MAAFTIPTIFTAVDRMGSLVGMAAKVEAFGTKAERAGRRASKAFESTYNNLGGKAAKAVAIGGIGLLALGVQKFVGEASKLENATVAFQPMLGSLGNAQKLVGELNKEAARTPFEFRDLAESANILLGFGAAGQNTVIPMMKTLGDLARGDSERLQRLSLNYGQVIAQGKASGADINQFAINGVPILAQLAKNWGTNVAGARKMARQGRATSGEITKAFTQMTSKGGMFYMAMELASQTFSGRLSTIKDNINLTFAEIGTLALPMLKKYQDKIATITQNIRAWAIENKQMIAQKIGEFFDGIGNAIKFVVDNFETIVYWGKRYLLLLVALKVISFTLAVYTNGLAIAMGLYRAVVFASNIVLGIHNALLGASAFTVMGNTVAYGAFRAVIVLTTGAQVALNAAMAIAAANPILAIVAGIGLITAAVALLITKYESLEEYQDKALKVNKQSGFQDEKNAIVQAAEAYEKYGKSKEKARELAVLDAKKNIEGEKAAAYYKISNATNDSDRRVGERMLANIEGRENALNQSSSVFKESDDKKELVNTRRAEAQAMQSSFNETITHQRATLDINDPTGRAQLSGGGEFIRINTTSTHGR